MSASEVLVVGEALVDVVRSADGVTRKHPGGSAANVAVALARLGRPIGLLTCLGRDDHGGMIEAHLAGAGVSLVGDPWVLERTSSATATLAVDGSATYDFDIAWKPRPVAISDVRAIHVGSIGAVLAPGASVVRDLVAKLAGRAVVSYDVNARTAITGAGPQVLAGVEALASRASVVKVSDEDLAGLWPALPEDAAVDRLLDLGAGAVVLTRGAAGASWRAPQQRIDVPAAPARVVDTIAAGDTFAATLIDGLLDLPDRHDESVEQALVRAAHAAAITVSRPGADPPTAAELRQAVATRGLGR
jgi:fructokinase